MWPIHPGERVPHPHTSDRSVVSGRALPTLATGAMENFVLIPTRSAKVLATHDRLGVIFKGILDGWQGSIDACCVCDDVVLWCIEVHTGGNSFVLGGHLINLQFT